MPEASRARRTSGRNSSGSHGSTAATTRTPAGGSTTRPSRARRSAPGTPGACPPPCPDDCTDHARHCPQAEAPPRQHPANGALVLRETVKEKKRKTVPIPAEVCEVLREHRSAQFEQRMLAGSEWTDHDLVFTHWNGSPVDPRRDWQDWVSILEAAGIPHAGVHAGTAHRGTIAIDEGSPSRRCSSCSATPPSRPRRVTTIRRRRVRGSRQGRSAAPVREAGIRSRNHKLYPQVVPIRVRNRRTDGL